MPNCSYSSGLKATDIFIILLSLDGFKSDCPVTKTQFQKVTVQNSIAELWTVSADHMIKYQHTHLLFYQISDLKPDIYLYGTLYPLS